MRSMRLTGFGVAHHFSVTVIGGDDKCATGALDCLRQPAEAGVDGLDRLDRCVEAAGMPDYVGIGVAEHDDVETMGCDRCDHFVGYLRSGHLGLLVVRRDLW